MAAAPRRPAEVAETSCQATGASATSEMVGDQQATAADPKLVVELTSRLKETTKNLQSAREKARRREKQDSHKLDLLAARVRHLESEKIFLAAQVDEHKSAVEAVLAQRDATQEELRARIFELEDHSRKQQEICNGIEVLRAQLRENNYLADRVQKELMQATSDADNAQKAEEMCKKQARWLQKRIHEVLRIKDKLLLQVETEKAAVQEMRELLTAKEKDVATVRSLSAEAALRSEQLDEELNHTKSKLKVVQARSDDLSEVNHQLKADLHHSEENLVQQMQARVAAEERSSVANSLLNKMRERVLSFLRAHGMENFRAEDATVEELLAAALEVPERPPFQKSPSGVGKRVLHTQRSDQPSKRHLDIPYRDELARGGHPGMPPPDEASIDELEVLDSQGAQPTEKPSVDKCILTATKQNNSTALEYDGFEDKDNLWGQRTPPDPSPPESRPQDQAKKNSSANYEERDGQRDKPRDGQLDPDLSGNDENVACGLDSAQASQLQSQDAIACIFAACQDRAHCDEVDE